MGYFMIRKIILMKEISKMVKDMEKELEDWMVKLMKQFGKMVNWLQKYKIQSLKISWLNLEKNLV